MRLCNISPKDLFYQLKKPLKHGLVTKQTVTVTKDGQNNVGLLFHLPRFYVEYRLKWQQNLYKVVKYLKSQVNSVGAYDDIKEVIGSDGYLNLKKFFKHPLVTKVLKINLNQEIKILRPDSDPKTWTGKNGVSKTTRVMQLADPDMDPEDILFYDKNSKNNEDPDDDEDDDEPEEDATADNTLVFSQKFSVKGHSSDPDRRVIGGPNPVNPNILNI